VNIKSEIPNIIWVTTWFYVFLYLLAMICGMRAFPLIWFFFFVYAFQILQICTDTEYYFRPSGDSPV
jgi:hypothetical protein